MTGNYGYDPSVYYAAADAFTHGRMPYRDFVLLHPPGIMLVLTPFAALGRATTDLTGFVAGNLALATLGACNAVLVFHVARRMGLARTAAWLGGVFYAVWYGAVYAELTSRLEPLGSFAFLCGLLALARNRPDRLRRDALIAGIAFGAAMSVKIWWVVPVVITAVWLARFPDTRRRFRTFVAGVFCAVLVIDGPFFLMAPSAMWHMVVLDQLGRHSIVGRVDRLVAMSTLTAGTHAPHGAGAIVIAVLFVGLLLACCASAWRVPPVRLLVLCTIAEAGVLVAAPSFFHFYLDYLTPSLAIVVAAAASRRPDRLRNRVRGGLTGVVVAAAATVTVGGALLKPVGSHEPFPTDQIADVMPQVSCVMTLTPMALIELNALSSDLGNHCPQWVDATGRTYGIDASRGPHYLGRRQNGKWQTDVQNYLMSGGAIVQIGDAGSLSAGTLDELRENQLITKDGDVTVYRVVPHSTAGRAGR